MMNISVPRGRCGPCCSVAATGRTAMVRAMSRASKSVQVISAQNLVSVIKESRARRGRRAAYLPPRRKARLYHQAPGRPRALDLFHGRAWANYLAALHGGSNHAEGGHAFSASLPRQYPPGVILRIGALAGVRLARPGVGAGALLRRED